ncbi:hypothetical protein [Methylobacterium dankookense]|nr:hypothetical protein [Methylobacterium dankookense]
MRARDVRIEVSGCAKSPPAAAVPPPPTGHGLTARELIRMAQAARRRND